jgi:hypothetical protein
VAGWQATKSLRGPLSVTAATSQPAAAQAPCLRLLRQALSPTGRSTHAAWALKRAAGRPIGSWGAPQAKSWPKVLTQTGRQAGQQAAACVTQAASGSGFQALVTSGSPSVSSAASIHGTHCAAAACTKSSAAGGTPGAAWLLQGADGSWGRLGWAPGKTAAGGPTWVHEGGSECSVSAAGHARNHCGACGL